MIDSDFMPMALEIYGACSEKFEDFLKMVKAAMNYWRKRFQLYTRLITQAYLVLFDNGGGNFRARL